MANEKSESIRGWQAGYWERLGICENALKETFNYSSPLDAWNNWPRTGEMVWLLKRAGVDNRVLAKCLLEIFNRFFPDWRKRDGIYPRYEIAEHITVIEKYIAGKGRLPNVRALDRMFRRDLGHFPLAYNLVRDPAVKREVICHFIYQKARNMLRMIVHDWKDYEFFFHSCFLHPVWWSVPGEKTRKQEEWAQDHIREYFPDPDVFMKEVLYGKEN
jgi:hypothetical protein